MPHPGMKNVVFRNPKSATVQDLKGHASFNVVIQGSRLIYQDRAGHAAGYIDHRGYTMSVSNHILAPNPRPDLLLARMRQER